MHSLLLRSAPLLVTPVLLGVSTFPGEFRVAPSFWLMSCLSAVVFLFGARWPLPVTLILSALAVPMFAAQAWGLSGLVPYLGAVALAELTARTERDAVVAVGANSTKSVGVEALWTIRPNAAGEGVRSQSSWRALTGARQFN